MNAQGLQLQFGTVYLMPQISPRLVGNERGIYIGVSRNDHHIGKHLFVQADADTDAEEIPCFYIDSREITQIVDKKITLTGIVDKHPNYNPTPQNHEGVVEMYRGICLGMVSVHVEPTLHQRLVNIVRRCRK